MNRLALALALACGTAAALPWQEAQASSIAAPAAPQEESPAVGRRMPMDLLEDFAQTGAEELGDYRGRLVVIELFAFW